jgi:hypothetical protein
VSTTTDFFAPPQRLPFAEYVAAALIEVARANGEVGIARPIEDLPDLLSNQFSGTFHAEEISDAVAILRECDVAYIARDPLAGTFVSVSEKRFSKFLEAVSRDKERYYKAVEAAGTNANEIFHAEEDTPTPSWDRLREHKVLERYSEFGSSFISAAMTKLGTSDLQNRLAAGSDRLISFADNMPIVEEIRRGLSELEQQLQQNNEVGNALGDEREEAIAEVRALNIAMSGTQSRAGYLLDLSKKTLNWIARITAKTSLESLVKKLVELFIGWLT